MAEHVSEHDIQSTFISWCRAQRDPRLALRVTAGMCYNSITCQGSEYGGFLFESLPDSQLNTVVGKAPVRLCVPVLPWQAVQAINRTGVFLCLSKKNGGQSLDGKICTWSVIRAELRV